MRTMTFREAVREALRSEMRIDGRVCVFGEDVASAGGVFKVTEGLLDEFGSRRVFDTPLSESAIVGAAVGAAMVGMKPVVEVMFADFVTVAMDAIVNYAAKVSYTSGGQFQAPLVVRMCYGATPRWGPHHSQSVEAWLSNVPGLTVLMPSNPQDAMGLLRSAIRGSNPVVFLEHKLLYGVKGEVADEDGICPLRSASVKRAGRDVTIVASGLMVGVALEAAAALSAEGIEAEVIDLRSIVPLDEDTLVKSIERTSRLVIVHEAPVRGGIGAEVAAVVASRALGYLDAPIQRVGAPWTPVPFGSLVSEYVPNRQKVVEAVLATIQG